MAEIGIFLASEEHGPRRLVEFAEMAEEAGFSSLLISDHYHPWIEQQGEASFVWSVIGAIAGRTALKVTTGVTCPTVRIHPAVLAQAAATAQELLDGRFVFGVGSGEALNEHILGHRWPTAETRLEMLEEAVGIMRRLWEGKMVTHHGRYYEVENARLYSLPASPPPIVVSSFGPKSLQAAASFGDGLVTTEPDSSVVENYRSKGGKGPAVAAVKVCWGEDERSALELARSLWATECLPGQLNQELSVPAHYEAAVELVTEEMVAEKISCGPDPETHVAHLSSYLEAGFDEVYVNQIGPDQKGFFDFFNKELRHRLT
jgi:G6PDH family F420-dependent oxidoreductase